MALVFFLMHSKRVLYFVSSIKIILSLSVFFSSSIRSLEFHIFVFHCHFVMRNKYTKNIFIFFHLNKSSNRINLLLLLLSIWFLCCWFGVSIVHFNFALVNG